MLEITSKMLKDNWENSTFDPGLENAHRAFDLPKLKFKLDYKYSWHMYGVYKYNAMQVSISGTAQKAEKFIYDEDIIDLLFDDFKQMGGMNNVNNFKPTEEQRELFRRHVQLNKTVQLREHEFSVRFGGWIAAYSSKRDESNFIHMNEHWGDMRVAYMLNLRACQKRFWWALFADWCERNCSGKVYFKGDMLIFEEAKDAVLFKMTYDLKVP